MKVEASNLETKFYIQAAQFTDIKEIARVHVNSWCETYASILPQSYLESLKYTDKEQVWERFIPRRKGMGGTLVAKNQDGEVVGFCDFGPAREHEHGFDSEIYALYLLKDYQGLGVGKNLLTQSFEKLKCQEYKSAYLWVLKDNPCKDFYIKSGGEYQRDTTIQIGEESYQEELYSWLF